MLTFPTLNGLVLLLAPPDALEGTAAAMLLMPMLNGILCASYLHGFERLLDWKFSPPAASGLMLAATSTVWLGVAGAVATGRWVVPSALQGIYIIGSIIAGLALCRVSKPARVVRLRGGSPQRLNVLVRRNSRRIVLFTLTLAAVATVGRLGGSPALLGALAGLPIVALFGLHAIAAEQTIPVEIRRDILSGMATSVWLGPGIAVAFVGAMWRVLSIVGGTGLDAGSGSLVHGAVALIAGWAVAIIAVWWVARFVPVLTLTRTPTRTP